MASRKRTVGSLAHADFGRVITVAGHPPGVLWSVQHMAAIGDNAEPWTRLFVRRGLSPVTSMDEAFPGLPPETPVFVAPELTGKAGSNG